MMKVEILLTKRKTNQNQNFKVLVTKPVAESDRNLGLALATRRHFHNYTLYISTRCRSAQVWATQKDLGLVGILQKN